jgi:hypothetical protein
MTGWVRDRLRLLAQSGQLGRRVSAAPVVLPAPRPATPASPAAEPSCERPAPPVKRLDPVD